LTDLSGFWVRSAMRSRSRSDFGRVRRPTAFKLVWVRLVCCLE